MNYSGRGEADRCVKEKKSVPDDCPDLPIFDQLRPVFYFKDEERFARPLPCLLYPRRHLLLMRCGFPRGRRGGVGFHWRAGEKEGEGGERRRRGKGGRVEYGRFGRLVLFLQGDFAHQFLVLVR
jgi:hypothetical protein